MYYIIITLLFITTLCIIAGFLHLYRVAQINEREMQPFTEKEYILNKQFGKTLVIYYSLQGHTADIANRIARLTNADIYNVQTIMPLNMSPLFYLKVKKQLLTKKYPGVNTDVPDLKQYDTVFIGAPVWWYTIATPMISFLKQVDFKGVRIAPFSTQGSNYGRFYSDLSKFTKNATILTKESFNNLDERYTKAIDNKVINWINNLQ